MRRRTALPPRRGTVLVFVAMLVFALMAMAALAVDCGLLIVTQRQMQSAVDSAALEGLRQRDATSDLARRQAASDLVSRVFDYRIRSDSDRTFLGDTSYDPMQVGAGPVLIYSGGQTQALALQQVQVPSEPFDHVYKPSAASQVSASLTFKPLQLNDTNNVRSGDLVAGTYNAGAAHTENSTYSRPDFSASGAGAAATAPSFLARMRRSNDFQGLDDVSGASSHGPGLPFLFGRGTLIGASQDPAQNPNGYNPRQHGLTVRATSIADARNAKSVGPVYPASVYSASAPSFSGLPGAPPLGLTLPTWKFGMTTLAAPAQPTDTVLTVVDGSSFPTVPFAVLIDTEVIFVTAIDSTNPNNWGVQRNRQNSTASPHAVGALVQLYSVYDVNVQGKITPTVNFAVQTTLAAAAQQTTTNLTVADGSSFPVVPFAVLIDSEIILVTALDPTKTNWTVQRGMWGTTAVAHQSNAQVLLYLGLPIPAPQGVTATATQLPVSNGSAFPAARFGTPASWFVVIVDAGNPVLEEIILVMDTTDPNNWTVQRGWLGTTPVAHSQYAQVQLYAGQMLRITSLVADQGFSITVSSGLNFPATVPGFPIAVPGDATQPPFLIRIENEVLLVTDGGRSKTQWTVVRAQEGTTATGHSASAQVLLHQRLGIGQIVDALSPSLVDGSAITTSSPRSSVPGNAAIGLPSFVPIFDNTSNLAMSNGALVVGFGQIQWNAYTGPGSLGNSVLIEKQSGAIASQNVTTVFTPPQILTAAQLTQVLATNKTLIEAVQAPALVRSIKP